MCQKGVCDKCFSNVTKLGSIIIKHESSSKFLIFWHPKNKFFSRFLERFLNFYPKNRFFLYFLERFFMLILSFFYGFLKSTYSQIFSWYKQRSFISHMEWAPFKSLYWKTNDSVANLTISFTSGVSLWDRPCC